MVACPPPPQGEEGTGEWILAVQATGKLITKEDEEETPLKIVSKAAISEMTSGRRDCGRGRTPLTTLGGKAGPLDSPPGRGGGVRDAAIPFQELFSRSSNLKQRISLF